MQFSAGRREATVPAGQCNAGDNVAEVVRMQEQKVYEYDFVEDWIHDVLLLLLL